MMYDTNETVRTVITTVRDNLRDVFDLNTSDEFIDQLASWVTDAINHALSPGGRSQTITGAIARDAAYHTLMIAPCDRCGAYVDIDTHMDEDGRLCEACHAQLLQHDAEAS